MTKVTQRARGDKAVQTPLKKLASENLFNKQLALNKERAIALNKKRAELRKKLAQVEEKAAAVSVEGKKAKPRLPKKKKPQQPVVAEEKEQKEGGAVAKAKKPVKRRINLTSAAGSRSHVGHVRASYNKDGSVLKSALHGSPESSGLAVEARTDPHLGAVIRSVSRIASRRRNDYAHIWSKSTPMLIRAAKAEIMNVLLEWGYSKDDAAIIAEEKICINTKSKEVLKKYLADMLHGLVDLMAMFVHNRGKSRVSQCDVVAALAAAPAADPAHVSRMVASEALFRFRYGGVPLKISGESKEETAARNETEGKWYFFPEEGSTLNIPPSLDLNSGHIGRILSEATREPTKAESAKINRHLAEKKLLLEQRRAQREAKAAARAAAGAEEEAEEDDGDDMELVEEEEEEEAVEQEEEEEAAVMIPEDAVEQDEEEEAETEAVEDSGDDVDAQMS